MIYLDNNATTRPAAEVIEAVRDCLRDQWANPSSSHAAGQAAKARLGQARAEVAALLGARPAEVAFTSGATEASVWAIRGALARDPSRRQLVLSSVEHPSVMQLARSLEREGVTVHHIAVDSRGGLDLNALRREVGAQTALVCVMAANNETGVCLPIPQVVEIAHRRDAPVFTDATQAAGRVPVDFAGWGVELLACSAHKLHGIKGSGALLIRKGFDLPPLLCGSQERGRRGGTENVPGIAGFGVAAALARQALAFHASRMAGLRDGLEQELRARLAGVLVYGAGAPRLPNTSCLRVPGLDAEPLLDRLERSGIVASSGSACSAGGTEPSHVLLAMGATRAEALQAIRISLSRYTTAAEMGSLADALCSLAAARRAAA